MFLTTKRVKINFDVHMNNLKVLVKWKWWGNLPVFPQFPWTLKLIYFLEFPWEIVFGCYFTGNCLHLQLEKMKDFKRPKSILVQGFGPLNTEITSICELWIKFNHSNLVDFFILPLTCNFVLKCIASAFLKKL